MLKIYLVVQMGIYRMYIKNIFKIKNYQFSCKYDLDRALIVSSYRDTVNYSSKLNGYGHKLLNSL